MVSWMEWGYPVKHYMTINLLFYAGAGEMRHICNVRNWTFGIWLLGYLNEGESK
jgi:hypothetical protein